MVEFLLIPSYYTGKLHLSDEFLNKLSEYKTLGIFAAVQFIHLDELVAQLKEKGIEVHTTHGKRTSGNFQDPDGAVGPE